MKYYKVVKKNLKSAVVNGIKALAIQYKIGEFVEGKLGSGIFVFDSLEDAKRFMNELNWNSPRNNTLSSNYYIYEADTKNLVKTVFWALSLCDLLTDNSCRIIKILKLRKNKKKYLHLMRGTPPKGTKCFKQVKLVKRVL